MSEAVNDAKTDLNAKLKEVVAVTQVKLIITDPEAVDANGRPIRMVRRAETNLGDLCADAYRDQSGADIAFVNGGGIRVNIEAGDITLEDILSVHPFGNSMCVIEVTGQQILDALEWGARSVPGENGGFLQVSGLSYEIHSYIESPCKQDENAMFVGIEGERRVKNVLFNGEPIDPNATYTLASHNYMLLDNGDGYTMFDGCKVLQESVKLDNQVLIDYITGTLNGVIPADYAEPYGQGRIVAVESAG
jgi:2',3'-cyclic-nucleotide 2'-phosphodiesterase (5'-nucleotidase family)